MAKEAANWIMTVVLGSRRPLSVVEAKKAS
jgi:hypothetical protein